MTPSILKPAEQAIVTGLSVDGLSPEEIRRVKQSGSPQFRVMSSTPEEEEDRVVRFVASDETPDRVGDVIEVAGWNLTSYKANPVVLWGHDSNDRPPIGRAANVRRGVGPSGRAALLASIEFAPAEAHEFADSVYQLTKAGYLNAVSVGFMPRSTKDISEKERQELGMPSYGLLYDSADLLEISVVSVPANPSALITGAKSLVDQGLLQGREVDHFLKQVPMTQEEISARLKSKIRGFVDLGAASKAAATAEAEESEAAKEPEASEAAEKAADEPKDKKALVTPAGLKHIAAVEETEGTVVITYVKAGYDYDEDPMMSGYSSDEDDDEPNMMGRSLPALSELIQAQTEQSKALTTLIDAVSDLTKRIHSVGEANDEQRRGFADSSDVVASDAQRDQREEKAHIEQLTTDFLQRLQKGRPRK